MRMEIEDVMKRIRWCKVEIWLVEECKRKSWWSWGREDGDLMDLGILSSHDRNKKKENKDIVRKL